jgi:hypothetical protein
VITQKEYPQGSPLPFRFGQLGFFGEKPVGGWLLELDSFNSLERQTGDDGDDDDGDGSEPQEKRRL